MDDFKPDTGSGRDPSREHNQDQKLDDDLAAEQAAIERQEQAIAARARQRTDDNARDLVRLMLLMLCIAVGILAYVLWDDWRQGQVISSRPIGTLQRMGSAGGLRGGVVLETETGFYPLDRPMAAAKGVALTLELRSNGTQFVCDPARVTCVRTTQASLQ